MNGARFGVMTPATLARMPSKGTARRTVRIADDLWNAAAAIAAERGEDLSAVIRDALQRYVRRHRKDTRTTRVTAGHADDAQEESNDA